MYNIECDRCGDSYHLSRGTTDDLPIGWEIVVIGNHKTRHLCAVCMQHLWRWFDEKVDKTVDNANMATRRLDDETRLKSST
jgi:hypothetical protein